ncbi:conserved Plasmodium protein, unknown function [Plasmodium sp. DRC-Itaito]|nr:conserved Plasmodium protein, unknown function [Plasmodium sp. DRC-Itaito]
MLRLIKVLFLLFLFWKKSYSIKKGIKRNASFYHILYYLNKNKKNDASVFECNKRERNIKNYTSQNINIHNNVNSLKHKNCYTLNYNPFFFVHNDFKKIWKRKNVKKYIKLKSPNEENISNNEYSSSMKVKDINLKNEMTSNEMNNETTHNLHNNNNNINVDDINKKNIDNFISHNVSNTHDDKKVLNQLDDNLKKKIEKEIISEKIANEQNEVIKKVKLPIIGTQLKPSGGFTKEILQIIQESNNYINEVNKEIINEKIQNKISGNDLSFFDTDETLERHELNYLNKIYDNNHILNIYNFLLVWKERKNIDLSVFVSKLSEHSNILPGERTVIKFSEVEKVQFLKKIRKNRNVSIAMIFVDNKHTNDKESSTVNHNMFPIGILAHPLDISLLDKTGEISVLNLYRFKIDNYNITNDDFLVNCKLFVDNNTTLNNFDLTQENKKIIMNLYDKILQLKILYNEKVGRKQENEKLKHVENITQRIDEYINVLNINKTINFKEDKLNFFTSLYLEYFSFLALDMHANIQTKLQLMYTDNTELRLHNVKIFLLQLYDDLKLKLKGL